MKVKCSHCETDLEIEKKDIEKKVYRKKGTEIIVYKNTERRKIGWFIWESRRQEIKYKLIEDFKLNYFKCPGCEKYNKFMCFWYDEQILKEKNCKFKVISKKWTKWKND